MPTSNEAGTGMSVARRADFPVAPLADCTLRRP